jgi:diguanylate cyclase (GGDEF)-like protein
VLDPFTTFLLTTVFMLLTGAVLGFIHPALPSELKPPASDWRIGTLLIAGGALLFASRGVRAVDWVVPIANGCTLLGFTLYWRAVRRYFGVADRWMIFLPAIIGVALLTIFIYAMPHFGWRVLIGSLAGLVVVVGTIATLLRHRDTERTISSKVLAGVASISAAFMAFRAFYIFANSSAQDSMLAPTNPINAISALVISLLPIVGTTSFVLLLFERIRNDVHRLATIDALTDLPNRRTINEYAEKLFAQARTLAQPLSVAVIDIDHFKQINDRFGHDSGDIVLKNVAKALKDNSRGVQRVGRQGGEEFIALFDDADAADAHAAAERLRIAVATESYALDERDQTVTVSIGVATMNENDASFDDLLRRADRALYAAKGTGRNCVRSA